MLYFHYNLGVYNILSALFLLFLLGVANQNLTSNSRKNKQKWPMYIGPLRN